MSFHELNQIAVAKFNLCHLSQSALGCDRVVLLGCQLFLLLVELLLQHGHWISLLGGLGRGETGRGERGRGERGRGEGWRGVAREGSRTRHNNKELSIWPPVNQRPAFLTDPSRVVSTESYREAGELRHPLPPLIYRDADLHYQQSLLILYTETNSFKHSSLVYTSYSDLV